MKLYVDFFDNLIQRYSKIFDNLAFNLVKSSSNKAFKKIHQLLELLLLIVVKPVTKICMLNTKIIFRMELYLVFCVFCE